MMKLQINNFSDSRKNKFLTAIFFSAFFLLAIIHLSCERLPQYALPEFEKFHYKTGDTIVFKSNDSRLNHLVIDEVILEFQPGNLNSSIYEYEHQKIQQHFLHEEDLIHISDSLKPLNTQCKSSNPFAVCDSLYNYRHYDMRISIVAKADINAFGGVGEKYVIWKNHWIHDNDYKNIGDLELNEMVYKNVFKLVREENLIDSLRPIKTIYFNNRFGIVKYETRDDEVFEFLEVR